MDTSGLTRRGDDDQTVEKQRSRDRGSRPRNHGDAWSLRSSSDDPQFE